MTGGASVERWRANLQGEVDGTAVYRAMARHEPNAELAALYARLADAEDRHAAVWAEQLKNAGAAGVVSPSWRARLLVAATRALGTGAVVATMASRETHDRAVYDDQPEAGVGLARDERSHARLLADVATGGVSGSTIARLEGRHAGTGGNALRAAVLGIDDGLLSNFGLVMGVAGAGADARGLVVAGLAGLLAGALSMALGEWLSVQSARELFSRQVAIEREELRIAPDEEEGELALIYRAKGLSEADATVMAKRVMAGESALPTLAREELGIDPDELGGSAYVAAATSFAMFAVGAAVPLLPLVFVGGEAAVVWSAALSGVALFGIGALVTVFTGRNAIFAGTRQLGIGVAAAAVTYLVGRLVGASVG